MIYINSSAKITKIFVESSYLKSDEITTLTEALKENIEQIEITFSGLHSLPFSVVVALLEVQEKLFVYANERMLWSYLSNLGLRCSHLRNSKFSNYTSKEIEALAIGGSAGSIEKIIRIVQNLPYADITVFITIHLLPDAKSYLCEILQNQTQYRVIQPSDSQKIEKNCIYIAPPSKHLLIKNKTIFLDDSPSLNFAKPSIDKMFESVSQVYGPKAIAILSCGFGYDGSASLKSLKERMTEVIIEDPSNCEAKDMLLHAISTNSYDRILSIEQIETYLDLQLFTSLFMEDEVSCFLEDIYQFYGYDFRNYEKKSLIRRIAKTQNAFGIDDFSHFKKLVFTNRFVLEQLVRNFSINVTTFFRNPSVFGDLLKSFQTKFDKIKNVRIWCAGCSSGQEPYSVAILFASMGLLNRVQIYATDFDASILMEAKNGIYPKNSLNNLDKILQKYGIDICLEEYFHFEKDYIVVSEKIKQRVLFFEHNLATDGSINEFDLILCRNVVIYFDRVLKNRVFELLDSSLFEEGLLILGESELPLGFDNYKNIGSDVKSKIFQKTSKKEEK